MQKDIERAYNQLTLNDLKFLCFEGQTYNKAFYPFMKYGRSISADQ